ncbi:MAG TPA: hypothetical protein VGL38_09515 [bacterium]|jgi:hypothetical protein
MELSFYDQNGDAIAYCEDGENIFLYDGQVVACFDKDRQCVYAYSGRYLGRFSSGWVRDLDGDYLLFTSQATGGPRKPNIMKPPRKAPKKSVPTRLAKHYASCLIIKATAWSKLTAMDFFLKQP